MRDILAVVSKPIYNTPRHKLTNYFTVTSIRNNCKRLAFLAPCLGGMAHNDWTANTHNYAVLSVEHTWIGLHHLRNGMLTLGFIPVAYILLEQQYKYCQLIMNSIYLLVKDLKQMMQGTLRLTGIISKLYWSRYLVGGLLAYVWLIPCKDIRPRLILNVRSYLLVDYVLLWSYNPDRILRKGWHYHSGTPCSCNTRCVCTGLVHPSCASEEMHDDHLPNWGALVSWVLMLPPCLDG